MHLFVEPYNLKVKTSAVLAPSPVSVSEVNRGKIPVEEVAGGGDHVLLRKGKNLRFGGNVFDFFHIHSPFLASFFIGMQEFCAKQIFDTYYDIIL